MKDGRPSKVPPNPVMIIRSMIKIAAINGAPTFVTVFCQKVAAVSHVDFQMTPKQMILCLRVCVGTNYTIPDGIVIETVI